MPKKGFKDTRTIEEKFNKHVTKHDANKCWDWKGAICKDGYGKLYDAGNWRRAHRISYKLFIGPIPEGFLVCHRCDNRICVNPAHLFIGTDEDNMIDKVKKGRHSYKLFEKDILEIRKRCSEGGVKTELAKEFGVTAGYIGHIAHRRLWKHI